MATISGAGAGAPTENTESGAASADVAEPARKNGLTWWMRLKRDRSLLIMSVPVVLLTIVFAYLPMFGMITAFKYYDVYDGFWASQWIGFTNFQQLFNDPVFWLAFKNTIVLSAIQLAFFFPIPIALALLLDSIMSSRVRSFVQSVVYLPHFFSWVLVITIFQQMLGGAGVINQVLRNQGLHTYDVMTSPDAFKYLLTAQVVWKEAGWGIIIFLAALAAIDRSLYEAAAADGAGRWRRLWHITLPGLRSIIVLLLVLRLGNALTVGFEQMLIQRQAVGADVSEVLDTFAYYRGVISNDFGFGTAVGIFKGVVSLVLILAANKVAHMFGEDGLYRR